MGLLVQGKVLQQDCLPIGWAGATWILAQCIEPLLWRHSSGMYPLRMSLDIQFAHDSVFLNGKNVSAEIRVDHVTTATRSVADAPSVREEMKKMQRGLSKKFNLVTEGRDQGTVVFPHAELKIYLDASPSARAARRYHERVEQGDKSRSMNEILHSQIERDQGDRERPVGAMEAAKDAIIINTDGLSLEKVVEQVLGLAHDRGLTSD